MSREDRNDRYIIKYGKFGAYFYDVDKNEDMTLEHVLGMINHLERRDSMGRR
ncbi:MAG: hypothetical protein QIT40_gp37 [Lokiarchaeia virus VerdaV4]|uniref:Uncharacterized protein n=1 Tax=Lokiarchaeia virus VerdaV4 TaxID=3070172 RepID=A0AA35GBQ9_9CAUD|nr:MAG: hypothetical protein QIT40_gp37 [Lokiarchaeia virus VerdaV4]BDI54995.1 MAG: hypothetical protein [Lokiarchaeia virus VerdaV4]